MRALALVVLLLAMPFVSVDGQNMTEIGVGVVSGELASYDSRSFIFKAESGIFLIWLNGTDDLSLNVYNESVEDVFAENYIGGFRFGYPRYLLVEIKFSTSLFIDLFNSGSQGAWFQLGIMQKSESYADGDFGHDVGGSVDSAEEIVSGSYRGVIDHLGGDTRDYYRLRVNNGSVLRLDVQMEGVGSLMIILMNANGTKSLGGFFLTDEFNSQSLIDAYEGDEFLLKIESRLERTFSFYKFNVSTRPNVLPANYTELSSAGFDTYRLSGVSGKSVELSLNWIGASQYMLVTRTGFVPAIEKAIHTSLSLPWVIADTYDYSFRRDVNHTYKFWPDTDEVYVTVYSPQLVGRASTVLKSGYVLSETNGLKVERYNSSDPTDHFGYRYDGVVVGDGRAGWVSNEYHVYHGMHLEKGDILEAYVVGNVYASIVHGKDIGNVDLTGRKYTNYPGGNAPVYLLYSPIRPEDVSVVIFALDSGSANYSLYLSRASPMMATEVDAPGLTIAPSFLVLVAAVFHQKKKRGWKVFSSNCG